MSKKIKDKRKSEITLCMLNLMATEGLMGASTVSISKSLNISQGLIHYHFKNKLEIILSVIDLLSSMLMSRYDELSQGCPAPSDKLSAFIDARLAKGSGESKVAVAAWVVVAAEAVNNPAIKEKYSNAIQEQSKLLNDLLSEINMYKDNKARELKVATLIAFMEGSFSLSVTADKVMPNGYAANMAKDILGIQNKNISVGS